MGVLDGASSYAMQQRNIMAQMRDQMRDPMWDANAWYRQRGGDREMATDLLQRLHERDLLERLRELDDDPAASAYVGSVVAEAIKEIERLRAMTTDEEEGRRQIEAMQPRPFAVGDMVRLSAGGSRTMTVVGLEDYGNQVVCEWGDDACKMLEQIADGFRGIFSARSLVRAE